MVYPATECSRLLSASGSIRPISASDSGRFLSASDTSHLSSGICSATPFPILHEMPIPIPPQVPVWTPSQMPFQIPQQVLSSIRERVPGRMPQQLPCQIPQEGPIRIPPKVPCCIPNQVREAAVQYGACPDPFTDADALEEIEEQVVTLAAHIHAATRRLLALIAEFDRRRGWELGGHRSCAHWLAFRTGMDLGAAREKVRAARALEELPEIGASMSRGELSFSKVRALTRVANAGNESDLLELARGVTAHQLERIVRAFRRGTREEEAARERRLHESRSFSVFPDEEGMYRVKGRLPAEVGALIMRAVEAASDQLFREERELEGTVVEDGVEKPIRVAAEPSGRWRIARSDPSGLPRGRRACAGETLRPVEDSVERAAQRRADALGLVAERALEVGFFDGPISGSRAGRYQVMVHVDERTLRENGEDFMEDSREAAVPDRAHPWGRSELEDGTRVAAETSRRLACDCGVVRVEHGGERHKHGPAGLEHGPVRDEHGSSRTQDRSVGAERESGRAEAGSAGAEHVSGRCKDGPGRIEEHRSSTEILNVGRRTRSIPPALRRALEVRDRGCRFPGCQSRYCDAHHVRHWADGGETSLANCLLLCRYHHRLVHEEGWTVEWWGPGRPAFRSPRGWIEFEGGWREPGSEGRKDVSAATSDLDSRGAKRSEWMFRETAEGSAGETSGGAAESSEGAVETSEGAAETEITDLATALVQANEALGISPDGWTPSARWEREVDIPDDVLERADEAILEGMG